MQKMRMLFSRGEIHETTLVKLVWQTNFSPVQELWAETLEAFKTPPKLPADAAKEDFHRHSQWAQPKAGMVPKHQWFYKLPDGTVHGPFETGKMRHWFVEGFFTLETLVRAGPDQTGQYATIGEHYPHCLQNGSQAADKIFMVDPLIPAKCRAASPLPRVSESFQHRPSLAKRLSGTQNVAPSPPAAAPSSRTSSTNVWSPDGDENSRSTPRGHGDLEEGSPTTAEKAAAAAKKPKKKKKAAGEKAAKNEGGGDAENE